MLFNRSAGILLHPTSLPNNEGIGTLGRAAYDFVDWLHAADIRLWQILPLGPTGYGDSPYAAFSSFAGNPLLIDLETLKYQGFLQSNEIVLPKYLSNTGNINFGSVVYWKTPLLQRAARRFLESETACITESITKTVSREPSKSTTHPYGNSPETPTDIYNAYRKFKTEKKHLHEYALFMSIKDIYSAKAAQEQLFGKLWNNYWPKELATCQPEALSKWEKMYAEEIELHKVIQFFFFEQWKKLKAYAHKKNISIIGDIPIFVAPDSSDVWANQHLFQLEQDGTPRAVAGVPPDYFSATGQLWGNPLYNWEAMKDEKYRWWLDRIDACLELTDYIRIDHFRGFQSYWAVPFGAENAIAGTWMQGPDHDFFEAVQRELLKKDPKYAETLPIIAEDLGIITPEVERLRDDFHLPGMKILQFAFDASEIYANGFTNAFLPHTYSKNSVVYTGTHDNTTLRAWLDTLSREDFAALYAYTTGKQPDKVLLDELTAIPQSATAQAIKLDFCRTLIKTAFMSVSVFALIPLQDLYTLGKEARMNEPATLGKNWVWRIPHTMLDQQSAQWLAHIVHVSGRNLPAQK